jgi:hypothetical protein
MIFKIRIYDTPAGMLQEGGTYAPPDFGRIEGAARQRRRAALLLAPLDFQTLQHPCPVFANF